jgi:hypothetical protein
MTPTMRYESQEAREIVLFTPIEHSIALGYDRLTDLLESRKKRKENEVNA